MDRADTNSTVLPPAVYLVDAVVYVGELECWDL